MLNFCGVIPVPFRFQVPFYLSAWICLKFWSNISPTHQKKTETNVTWRNCWWKKTSGNHRSLGCKKTLYFTRINCPPLAFDAGFLPSPVWKIFFSSEISSLLTPRIVKTRQMPSTTCAKMAMHRALCDYFGIAFAAVEGRMQNIQMLWIWQSLFDFLRDIQFRWYCCGETENLQNECGDQCCTLCDVFSKLHLSLKDGLYGHKSEVRRLFWYFLTCWWRNMILGQVFVWGQVKDDWGTSYDERTRKSLLELC